MQSGAMNNSHGIESKAEDIIYDYSFGCVTKSELDLLNGTIGRDKPPKKRERRWPHKASDIKCC